MTERAPAPRPLRGRPLGSLPTLIGAAVLAILVIAVVLVLTSESGGPDASASPTAAGASSSPSEPAASPSTAASESASARATASAPPGEPEVGAFVTPVVDGVTLRESPDATGARIGSLARGSVNLVLEGPADADGYRWFRLSASGLPPSSGCITPLPTDPLSCPIWFGWAAAGESPDQPGWFAPIEVECPDADDATGDFLELPQRVPLGCYGTAPITFTGWYPGPAQGDACDAEPEVAWLYCPDTAHDVWTDPEGAAAFQRLHVDPASGVVIPAPDQWLRITGAFDHPDAALCAAAEEAAADDPDPDLAVLECRVRFVVHGVEVTEAP